MKRKSIFSASLFTQSCFIEKMDGKGEKDK